MNVNLQLGQTPIWKSWFAFGEIKKISYAAEQNVQRSSCIVWIRLLNRKDSLDEAES